MAVTNVKELGSSRRSSKKNGKTTHVRGWLVTCDDKNDGTAAALDTDGIPEEGDLFEDDIPGLALMLQSKNTNPDRLIRLLNGRPLILCTGVDAQPHEKSDRHFLVEATYEQADLTTDAITAHPLKRAPKYSWSGEEITEPYFYDYSSPPKPVVNTAFDPFENPFERDRAIGTITITRNEATWSQAASFKYWNSTNADPQSIDETDYPADILKMGIVSASSTSELWYGITVDFYEVTYNIRADADGWKDKPLSLGFNEIKLVQKNVNGTLRMVQVKSPIVDATGLKVSKEWPLDVNGKALPSADDAPAILEFLPQRSISWAELNLI